MAKNVRNDHNWSVRVTAAAARTSGQLCVEEGWFGLVPVDVASGVDYEILCRPGLEVEVNFVATSVRGSVIYWDATLNAGAGGLSLTATSNRKVGKVSAIQGQKGTPTGKMRMVLSDQA